ncbi:MAG: WbuC family cupin fold metalloprotein, partial [Bacteroidota bacterium]
IKIQESLLCSLTEEARKNPRRRKNHNFHKEDSDTLQRMLNALEPSTYVRPHKHVNPDKREVFVLLKGKIVVVEFDDNGNISDRIILDNSKGNYAVEITPGSWHTVISLESGSVYYEVKDGPYDPVSDKVFADWSPVEDAQEAKLYLDNLKKEICSV